MIEYDLKKNNNKKNVKAYGKYYAKRKSPLERNY